MELSMLTILLFFAQLTHHTGRGTKMANSAEAGIRESLRWQEIKIEESTILDPQPFFSWLLRDKEKACIAELTGGDYKAFLAAADCETYHVKFPPTDYPNGWGCLLWDDTDRYRGSVKVLTHEKDGMTIAGPPGHVIRWRCTSAKLRDAK